MKGAPDSLSELALPRLNGTTKAEIQEYQFARKRFLTSKFAIKAEDSVTLEKSVCHLQLIGRTLLEEIKKTIKWEGGTKDLTADKLEASWEDLIEAYLEAIINPLKKSTQDTEAFLTALQSLKMHFKLEDNVGPTIQNVRIEITELARKFGCHLWRFTDEHGRKKIAEAYLNMIVNQDLRRHIKYAIKTELDGKAWATLITAAIRRVVPFGTLDEYGKEAKKKPKLVVSEDKVAEVTTDIIEDDGDDDDEEEELILPSRSGDRIVVNYLDDESLIIGKGSWHANLRVTMDKTEELIKMYVHTHKQDQPVVPAKPSKAAKARSTSTGAAGYDKKTNVCFNCGVAGHDSKQCKKPKNVEAATKRWEAFKAARDAARGAKKKARTKKSKVSAKKSSAKKSKVTWSVNARSTNTAKRKREEAELTDESESSDSASTRDDTSSDDDDGFSEEIAIIKARAKLAKLEKRAKSKRSGSSKKSKKKKKLGSKAVRVNARTAISTADGRSKTIFNGLYNRSSSSKSDTSMSESDSDSEEEMEPRRILSTIQQPTKGQLDAREFDYRTPRKSDRPSKHESRGKKDNNRRRSKKPRTCRGRLRKLSLTALAANSVITKSVNAKAAHDFIVEHDLHPDGWIAEVTMSDGISHGATEVCILDSGSDFLYCPTHVADTHLKAGGTMYEPSQKMIDQASTSAEVRGMIYGTVLLHSPTGGVITFKNMQMGVLDGDTILVSSWMMKKMSIETYSIAEECAKRHAVFEGNSTFIPEENTKPRVRTLRVEEPLVTESFDSCMEQIPAMTSKIKARYIAASERFDLEDRLSSWDNRA